MITVTPEYIQPSLDRLKNFLTYTGKEGTPSLGEDLSMLIDELALMHRAMWGVVANAGSRSNERQPRWVHVMRATAYGSNTSWKLCESFGFNPDEMCGTGPEGESDDE